MADYTEDRKIYSAQSKSDIHHSRRLWNRQYGSTSLNLKFSANQEDTLLDTNVSVLVLVKTIVSCISLGRGRIGLALENNQKLLDLSSLAFHSRSLSPLNLIVKNKFLVGLCRLTGPIIGHTEPIVSLP